jgi:hypothetical protein
MFDPLSHREPARSSVLAGANVVHFYDPADFPAARIAEFFGAGLAAGDSELLIATPAHTALIRAAMDALGADTASLQDAGLLVCLDAAATLAAFPTEGSFSKAAVDAILGSCLIRASARAGSRKSRVFGELADLLAAAGDHSRCLDLERHWNRLLLGNTFRLQCAYSTASFKDISCARAVCEVCDLHDEIAPFRDALAPTDWLSLFLEGARALKIEVRRSRASENTLRSWELNYGPLFEARLARWRDELQQHLLVGNPSERFDSYPHLDAHVEDVLFDILVASQEAGTARQSAAEGTAEWYKRTGEILAYGRLTHLFCRLRCQVAASDDQSDGDDANDEHRRSRVPSNIH